MKRFRNPEEDFAEANEAYHHMGIFQIAVGRAKEAVERFREQRFITKVNNISSRMRGSFSSADGNVSIDRDEDRILVRVKQGRVYYDDGAYGHETGVHILQDATGVRGINATRREWSANASSPLDQESAYHYDREMGSSADNDLDRAEIIAVLEFADNVQHAAYSQRLGR